MFSSGWSIGRNEYETSCFSQSKQSDYVYHSGISKLWMGTSSANRFCETDLYLDEQRRTHISRTTLFNSYGLLDWWMLFAVVTSTFEEDSETSKSKNRENWNKPTCTMWPARDLITTSTAYKTTNQYTYAQRNTTEQRNTPLRPLFSNRRYQVLRISGEG